MTLTVPSELALRLLELTRDRGRITVAEAVKLTGASRNTLKDQLKVLTEQGHLKLQGAGRGAFYILA